MQKLIFISLLIGSFFSCETALKEEIVYDENGNIFFRYFQDPETGEKSGPYQRYFEDGNVFEEGSFLNGEQEGKCVHYYKSGQIKSISHLSSGKYIDTFRSFYENGELELSGSYAEGEMHGVWEKFYPNGKLMEKTTFETNLENGPFTEYYENGNLKAQGTYKDGDAEHGELKLYSDDGELERIMDCNMGICRTTWTRTNN